MPVTVYDTAKVPIECRAPDCGDVSLYLIKELEANNEIPCPYCGQPIDLSSEQWRAAVRKTAEYYKAVILAES
jgi:hypothetical protein